MILEHNVFCKIYFEFNTEEICGNFWISSWTISTAGYINVEVLKSLNATTLKRVERYV